MKNLDLLSKRILVGALSLSMVLCSASLFVRTVKSANAAPVAPIVLKGHTMSASGDDEYPFGIANGYAYWLEYANGNFTFNKKALTDF